MPCPRPTPTLATEDLELELALRLSDSGVLHGGLGWALKFFCNCGATGFLSFTHTGSLLKSQLAANTHTSKLTPSTTTLGDVGIPTPPHPAPPRSVCALGEEHRVL